MVYRDDDYLARLAAKIAALVAELDQLLATGCDTGQLAAQYQRTLAELCPLLPELALAELARLRLSDSSEGCTTAELRIACAQLLGWLKALHGQLGMTHIPAPAPRRPAPALAA